jgi:hypothetical protein
VLAVSREECWPCPGKSVGRAQGRVLAVPSEECWPCPGKSAGRAQRRVLAVPREECWPCPAKSAGRAQGRVLAVPRVECWPCPVGRMLAVTVVSAVISSCNFVPRLLAYPRSPMSVLLGEGGHLGATSSCSKNGWTN